MAPLLFSWQSIWQSISTSQVIRQTSTRLADVRARSLMRGLTGSGMATPNVNHKPIIAG